jgi:hypothetical protein
MTIFSQIASKIIKEQELIIGPLAWEEAGKVGGIRVVDRQKGEVELDAGKEHETIDRLVSQYERLFGKASREACREAVGSIIADLPPSDVPMSLK